MDDLYKFHILYWCKWHKVLENFPVFLRLAQQLLYIQAD